MKNNPHNTAEHTREDFEEEHFIVSRMKCNTEKGLLVECLLSIFQRAMILKGRWEYYIPITGNGSLFTVPSTFAILISSISTLSLLFIWPVYFQVNPLFMAAFESFWILKSIQFCQILVCNGKFLRCQCWGKQFYPTVVDCTWRICSSSFLLPASECCTGRSGCVLKKVV